MGKENKIKKTILENEIIKKITKELNLNSKQLESGYDVFLRIIEENKNIQEYEYITKVKVYDDENIIGISVLNKNAGFKIKRNKYYLLNNISNASEKIVFSNPKEKNEIDINSKVFYWKFNSLEENDRRDLAKWLKDFHSNLINKKHMKGIYIYGTFGIGKTFFLNALTNYIIEKNKTVIFLTTMDLYEYMTKNLERNNDLNYDCLAKMKNVDILIIDDIGSEKQSSWFLFLILYPVLEYRLKENKIVCFSSNLSISELKKYWLKSKELDTLKVNKLIDKITSLTSQIHLKGESVREIG